MAYKRNRKEEKEDFEAVMGKLHEAAECIVDKLEHDRVKELCAHFLTVALGAYKFEKGDSPIMTLFDAILSQVNIHIHCVDGKED